MEIISIFKKEEEIKKIVNKLKNYSFNDLKRSAHFEFSLMEKMTDEMFIREVFPKFDLIKTIELRKNKGREYYSFNYELDDETYVVIALVLDKEPPIIINAFHAQKSYKRFEKSLRKHYSKRFV